LSAWLEGGTAEQNIIDLEQRLYATLDAAERNRLLRCLIKEGDRFAKNVEFADTLERQIAKADELIRRQKELVARLKREGRDTTEAYFLLTTMKTTAALFAHRYAMAKKVLFVVVPGKG
jgi:hypothetical protein